MKIGALRVELLVPGANSLKDKRRAVKGLKDRIRHRFNVSVAEVDHQDLQRRSALAVAAAGADGPYVRKVLEEVLRHVRRDANVQVASYEIEMLC